MLPDGVRARRGRAFLGWHPPCKRAFSEKELIMNKLVVAPFAVLCASLLTASCAAPGATGEADEEDVAEAEDAVLTSDFGDHYSISSLRSGRCLDVAGGSTQSGVVVNQFRCHGGPNQGFRLESVDAWASHHRIKNQHSGLCLEVTAANGLRQATCNPASNAQKFVLDYPFGSGVSMSYHIVRLKSYADTTKCLAVPNNTEVSGVQIQQASCSDSAGQRWLFQPRYDSTVGEH
jgi:hypothetical protein